MRKEEIRPGDVCLYEQDGDICEVKVIEKSPSGQRLLVAHLDGVAEWISVIHFIEQLEDKEARKKRRERNPRWETVGDDTPRPEREWLAHAMEEALQRANQAVEQEINKKAAGLGLSGTFQKKGKAEGWYEGMMFVANKIWKETMEGIVYGDQRDDPVWRAKVKEAFIETTVKELSQWSQRILERERAGKEEKP